VIKLSEAQETVPMDSILLTLIVVVTKCACSWLICIGEGCRGVQQWTEKGKTSPSCGFVSGAV
jgi:hypothetical protein